MRYDEYEITLEPKNASLLDAFDPMQRTEADGLATYMVRFPAGSIPPFQVPVELRPLSLNAPGPMSPIADDPLYRGVFIVPEKGGFQGWLLTQDRNMRGGAQDGRNAYQVVEKLAAPLRDSQPQDPTTVALCRIKAAGFAGAAVWEGGSPYRWMGCLVDVNGQTLTATNLSSYQPTPLTVFEQLAGVAEAIERGEIESMSHLVNLVRAAREKENE